MTEPSDFSTQSLATFAGIFDLANEASSPPAAAQAAVFRDGDEARENHNVMALVALPRIRGAVECLSAERFSCL